MKWKTKNTIDESRYFTQGTRYMQSLWRRGWDKKLTCVKTEQAGFGKGRGTIDNVEIVRHNGKEKHNRKRRLFVDLKTAFDNVDKKCLWE